MNNWLANGVFGVGLNTNKDIIKINSTQSWGMITCYIEEIIGGQNTWSIDIVA